MKLNFRYIISVSPRFYY